MVSLEGGRKGEEEEEEDEGVEVGGEGVEENGAEGELLLRRWRQSTTLLIWTLILNLMLDLRLSLMLNGGRRYGILFRQLVVRHCWKIVV